MGTTAQKLEYLGTTKSQLKDMINYGLDDDNKITSTTTFRNYVESVFKAFLESLNNPSTLFNNLPKITGSGSNITLNNTANAPMRIMLNATELTQDGTPTPTNPQDIHTISGDNTIVVSGKNLFDGSRNVNSTFTASVSTALEHFKATGEYATGYCDNTNKINAYAGTYETCFVQVAPNTTYRLSSQGAENNGFSCIICLDNNGNSLQASTNWRGANYTINTPAGTKYLMFSPRNANVMYVQLEYGETTTTFEPYVSQTAEVNLGNNILNLVKDKNFFEHPAGGGYATYRLTDDKAIYLVGGSTGWGWSYTNCQIKQTLDAGTYTISISQPSYEAKIYDSDNTQLKTTIATPQTITLSQTATVGIGIKVEGKSPVYVQIEKGSKGTQIFYYDKQINYSKIGNYKDQFIRTSGLNLIGLDTQQYKVSLKAGDKIYAQNTTSTALTLNLYTNYGDTTRNDYWSVSANGSRVITVANESNAIAWATAVASDGVAWVSYGETATSYEPYGTNEWYIKKNIGKVVLDGNSNIEETISFGSYYRAKFSISDILIPTANSIQLYSNYFYGDINALNSSNANVGMMAQFRNDNKVYFITEETSSADFKTWLSTHNTTVYYVMATPTYTPITGTLAEQLEYVYQLLKSYKGVTNISQVNNDLAFELDVEAIEEI